MKKVIEDDEKVLFQLLLVDAHDCVECQISQVDQEDMTKTPLLTYAIKCLIRLCGKEAFDYALSRVDEAEFKEIPCDKTYQA